MNLAEKIFALKQHPLFSTLEDSELILIADVTVSRRFEPGATIAEAGTLLNRVYVVTEGSVAEEEGSRPSPLLVGVESLLLNKPIDGPLIAQAESGAHCLVIGKSHFFTIINECPEVLVHYLEGARAHG